MPRISAPMPRKRSTTCGPRFARPRVRSTRSTVSWDNARGDAPAACRQFGRLNMNARSWMAVLVALGVALVPLAAGEESPHELAVKQVLKSLDKLTMALSGVKDAETAQAARPELRKAAKDWTE